MKEYGFSSDSIKKFIANGFETEELFNLLSDERESASELDLSLAQRMLLRKYLDEQVKDVLVSPEKPESGKQSSSPPILEEKDTMMPLSDVLKSLSEDPVGPRQAPISAQIGRSSTTSFLR